MTMKTEPFLDGKWGWDLGEGDWKDGVDENFLKFSYMLNGNVDSFVSSLPVSPTDGDAHFLTSDNTLNVRVESAWYKFPVPKNFIVTEKATGLRYEFDGSNMVASLSLADKTKLAGITAGATANSTDASLRDRTTHTGVQAISTVTGLQTALNLKSDIASPTFTGTPLSTTPATSDNSTKIATTAYVKAQAYGVGTVTSVNSVSPVSGAVTLVKGDLSLGNIDNTSDANKPVSSATQTALNLKSDKASPTFTGTVVLPSTTSIGTITNTEISYLSGATSSIQGQINSLSGSSGAFAPINNPTFTGTVGGITKAMVGLGNVDNTSDASKPVSTAAQTALNAKQATLGGTGFVKSTAGTISYDTSSYITGNQTITVTGDGTGSGTTAITFTLGNTGVTAGTYGTATTITPITINAKGLATAVGSAVTIAPAWTSVTGKPTTFSAAGFTDTFVQQGTGVSQTSNAVKIGWSAASKLKVTVDTTDLGNMALESWVSGNYLTSASPSFSGTLSGSNITISGTFTGSGAGITNMNASAVSAGVFVPARLPYTFSSVSGASTGVLRDSNGDINTRITNATSDINAGGNLNATGAINATSGNIVGTAPIIIMRDTDSPVSTMTNYIQFRDNTASDMGRVGYGGTGELTIDNSTRNVRVSSPAILTSTLYISGALSSAAGANFYSASGTNITVNNDSSTGGITCQLSGTTKGYINWNSVGLSLLDSVGTSRIDLDTTGVTLNGQVNSTYLAGRYAPLSAPAFTTSMSFSDVAPIFTIKDNNSTGGSVNSIIKFTDSLDNRLGSVGIEGGVLKFSTASGTGGYSSMYFDFGSNQCTFSGSSLVLPSTTNLGFITPTKFGWLSSISSDIQTQLSSKLTKTGDTASGEIKVTFDAGATPNWNTTQHMQLGNASGGNPVSLGFVRSGFSDIQLVHYRSGYLDLMQSSYGTMASLAVDNISFNSASQKFQSITATGAVSINAVSGVHILANCTGNTTWTFPSPSSTEVMSLTIELTNGGAFTQTWPAGTRWTGGSQPQWTASGTDVIVFTKAGTNAWRGYLSSKDSK